MTLTFDEVKLGVDTHLQALQRLKNITGDKTYSSLCKLRSTFWELANPSVLGVYLVREGFGQVFLDLWKRLSKYLTKQRDSSGYRNVIALLGLSITASDKSKEFGDELIRLGWAAILLDIIKQQDLDDEIRALYLLGGLFNCIRMSSGNRDAYRKAKAIGVLQPLLTSPNVEIQTNALIVLAYVVNEKEREILATSESGLKQLLTVLNNGVDSPDHRAATGCSSYTMLETLDAINQLAINDTSKAEIARQGAIPAIVRMLDDDFSDQEHRVALEALWNLAFVDSIRNSEVMQLTIPSKCCVRGRFKTQPPLARRSVRPKDNRP